MFVVLFINTQDRTSVQNKTMSAMVVAALDPFEVHHKVPPSVQET